MTHVPLYFFSLLTLDTIVSNVTLFVAEEKATFFLQKCRFLKNLAFIATSIYALNCTADTCTALGEVLENSVCSK